MKTTGLVTELSANQVFVFGSNEAGRHGRGAAATARQWGARYGKGVGHFGRTYAIPTKDAQLRPLSTVRIKRYVAEFIEYAREKPNIEFLVTEIGCGLAGYKPSDIAWMFRDAPNNVTLPKSFQPA
jgi:hypothetical protein